MTKFSQTMLSQQVTEFKGHYVSYKSLKKKIKQCHARCLHECNENSDVKEAISKIKETAKKDEQSALQMLQSSIVGEIQKEFFIMLEKEIEKTSVFYTQLTKNIIREMNQILSNRDHWKDSHDHYLMLVIESLSKIGNETIELCHFLELNVTAIRKILKKFDKAFEDITIPVAHLYLSNNLKQGNSKLMQLLSHKVIYEVFLILEDCHKQLRKIVSNRNVRPKQNPSKAKSQPYYQYKARDLTAFEELKRPLIQESHEMNDFEMIPEGLGSQHINRMMLSKLKILKNTIDIIDESIVAIQYSSSFAVISHDAQVMIDSYKEAESHEAILFTMGQKKHQDQEDYLDDDTSDEEYRHPNNESSFNIKSLNLRDLDIYTISSKKRQSQAHDLLPEGDYVSLNLLFVQAYLYTFNHYLIVPSIFMFANDLGYSPAYAGLLLAMTPFSTSFYAIVTNYWTRASFKYPLLLGIVSIIASNVLYIYAYQESSMFYLLLSRLLFGIGGSKVIHRKYIANFVQRARWTKYYQRLIFSSFLGMIMGPLVYLLMITANRNFLLVPNTYLLAAYFGLGLFGLLFVVLLCFFGGSSYSQREQNQDISLGQNLFGAKESPSLLSLESGEEKPPVNGQSINSGFQEADFEHYNQTLKQINEFRSFWALYGSYLILITLKFIQKLTQDALIVILPVLLSISMEEKLPLKGIGLVYICLIYAGMGGIAVFVSIVVGKIDIALRDRSLLLSSILAASLGLCLQIHIVNQGDLLFIIAGFIITFIGIEIMDYPITALTAKFTPPHLGKGILNPSFLLTFAATFGRTIGCLTITLADLVDIEKEKLLQITNYTFMPLLAVFLAMFLVVSLIYQQLRSSIYYQYQVLERQRQNRNQPSLPRAKKQIQGEVF